jgi:hypothetical protein
MNTATTKSPRYPTITDAESRERIIKYCLECARAVRHVLDIPPKSPMALRQLCVLAESALDSSRFYHSPSPVTKEALTRFLVSIEKKLEVLVGPPGGWTSEAAIWNRGMADQLTPEQIRAVYAARVIQETISQMVELDPIPDHLSFAYQAACKALGVESEFKELQDFYAAKMQETLDRSRADHEKTLPYNKELRDMLLRPDPNWVGHAVILTAVAPKS